MTNLRGRSTRSEGEAPARTRCLEFTIERGLYAIPLPNVREIVARPEASDFLRGFVQIRGRVLSLLDLNDRLGFAPSPRTTETSIVITDFGCTQLGLIVDSVGRVRSVPNQDLLAPLLLGSLPGVPFITACYRIQQQVVLCIDVQMILRPDELQRLRQRPQDSAV